ncbi:MAG: hypothetical protein N4A48_12305 [Tepidibacter sp.]|uniref:hypothetical protein n=1 Tax=Tepidibacter sp. TaxID=2529387 RepID=UPI0025E8990F|nr:hypothetical protein [Tepidibacter sp.]MCT4509512.1 hypothetical protein [Tepidibacter sp.]
MERNEMMSLSEIIKEMFDDMQKEYKSKNGEEKDIIYSNYYDTNKDRFKEILTILGVDNEVLKKINKNEYEIPKSKKNIVKKLLNDYTKKPMKNYIRKKKFDEVQLDNLQEIVADVESLLKGKLEEEKYINERNKMYFNTRYPIRKAIEDTKKEAVEQILEDIEEIKPIFAENNETLNDSDKIYLINYYKDLLKQVSSQWKQIVENVNDIRLQEITEISEQSLNNEIDDEDAYEELSELMDDSRAVVWQAIMEYKGEIDENKIRKLKKPSKKDLEEVKKLIDGFKKN